MVSGSESDCFFYVVIVELLDGQAMEVFALGMVEDILTSLRDIEFVRVDGGVNTEMVL